MPRNIVLCAITSHVSVEIGDTIYPPGFGMPGKLAALPDGAGMSLEVEAKMKVGDQLLVTSADALGLVWIDEVYTQPRPSKTTPFDHRPGVIHLREPDYLRDLDAD